MLLQFCMYVCFNVILILFQILHIPLFHANSVSVLPRDAMLVRYMLSLCVCLSIHLSHAGIVSKQLNKESRKQRRTIAQGL